MARERIVIAPIAADPAAAEAIVERARQRGFSRFAVDAATAFTARAGEEVVLRHADHLERLDRPGSTVPVVRVADPEGLVTALARVPPGGTLAVEWTGDRVIPLENAIAARGRSFELWTYARGPSEVSGALGALEHGADRVIVEVRSPADVEALEKVVESPLPSRLEWNQVRLTFVRAAGLGDRVIVDTTSLLRPSEGLLVGSAAAFLFHVASEAVGSTFSRARPFRVNAGAAHSYVLMADGSTRYLAELESGDAVLATEPNGPARSVRVGRLKIERRPMVAVCADDEGTRRTVFLQEAETVRLSTDAGRRATTELAEGSSVYGVRLPPARHLGRHVEESIEER